MAELGPEHQSGTSAAERGLWADRVLLLFISNRTEEIMAAIDDLRASVSNLQTQEGAEEAELGTIVTALQSATDQIAQLQAQVAAGGNVTEADLEGVATQLTTIADSAAAATSSAQAAAGGGGPAPAPSPAPTPAPPATPTTPGAPTQSVYTFDGDPGTVDQSTWIPSGFQTDESPARPLYYFSGDVNPGDQNGDGINGQWHVFTGSAVLVPGNQPAEGQELGGLAEQQAGIDASAEESPAGSEGPAEAQGSPDAGSTGQTQDTPAEG